MSKYHDTFTPEGLSLAKYIVNQINQAGGKAEIAETYRDFGQDWKWDTILAKSQMKHTEGLTYQLLYPVEFDKINNGSITPMEIQELVDRATKKES